MTERRPIIRFVPIVAQMPKRYLPRSGAWMGDAHARLRAIGQAVGPAG